MNAIMNYITTHRTNTIIFFVIAVILFIVAFNVGTALIAAGAEDQLIRCWILCKPGDYVNVRRTPSYSGMEVGRLDCGDWFLTDAESKNGFIRCYGIGEYGEGWVFAGYVSTEPVQAVGERFVCVAPNRVACRRYMNGPKTANPWLKNGSFVQVFTMADGWACTSRGYIRSEYLEVSPE